MSSNYNRKDHFYNEAKEKGIRSRAYFKLEELDKKYNLIKKASKVADLGAWPGGWMQYVQKKILKDGLLVGIDLVEIDGFNQKNIFCIQGDLNDKECLSKVLEISKSRFDIVISDMSPKLSGIKESDQARCVAIAELAIYCSSQLLADNGSLVIKVFKGNETEDFIRNNRKFFQKFIRAELDSTRKTSNEFYIVGQGFKLNDYLKFIDEYYSTN